MGSSCTGFDFRRQSVFGGMAVLRATRGSILLAADPGWELIVGALAAIYLSSARRAPWGQFLSNTATVLGLCLILLAILRFDERTPYPSIYTLIPTSGAALVILFCSSDTVMGRMLSHPILVQVGLISYSIYLWRRIRYLLFTE